MGSITIAPLDEHGADASWDVATTLFSALPGLMDAGVAGAMSMASGSAGKKFNPLAPAHTKGAVVVQTLWSFNTSTAHLDTLLQPTLHSMHTTINNTINMLSVSSSTSQLSNYTAFHTAISDSNTAGPGGVSSRRLLGHRHLAQPHATLRPLLQRAVAPLRRRRQRLPKRVQESEHGSARRGGLARRD